LFCTDYRSFDPNISRGRVKESTTIMREQLAPFIRTRWHGMLNHEVDIVPQRGVISRS